MSCVVGYLSKSKILQYSAVYDDPANNRAQVAAARNVGQSSWCTDRAGTNLIGLAIEEAVVVGGGMWSVPVQRYGPLRMQWRHDAILKHNQMLGLDMTTVVAEPIPRLAVLATVLDYFGSSISVFIRYQEPVAALAPPVVVGAVAMAGLNANNIDVLCTMFHAFFDQRDVNETAALSMAGSARSSTNTENQCTNIRLEWREIVIASEFALVYEIPTLFGNLLSLVADANHKLSHIVHGDVYVDVNGVPKLLHQTKVDFEMEWKQTRHAYYNNGPNREYIFYPDETDITIALNVDCEDDIKVKLHEVIHLAADLNQQLIEYKIEESTATPGVDAETLLKHITAAGTHVLGAFV